MSDISLRMDLLNANIEIEALQKRIAELEAALESVSEVFGGPKEQSE